MMELRLIMKDFRFDKVQFWFNVKKKKPYFELICCFRVFLR